nr:hypothetical protein [Streptomyces sp. CYG21]
MKSTERLAAHADSLVVNVSSPNTPGLRNLQATESAAAPAPPAVREAARPHRHRAPRTACSSRSPRTRGRGRGRRRGPRRGAGARRGSSRPHHHRPRGARP